jgi:hypothetical protein
VRSAAPWLVTLSVALVALGVYGERHSRRLEREALTRQAGIEAAASDFIDSFAGEHQETELRLLDERRALLLSAARWRHGAVFSFLLAGLSLFAAWLARELRRWFRLIDGEPAPATGDDARA